MNCNGNFNGELCLGVIFFIICSMHLYFGVCFDKYSRLEAVGFDDEKIRGHRFLPISFENLGFVVIRFTPFFERECNRFLFQNLLKLKRNAQTGMKPLTYFRVGYFRYKNGIMIVRSVLIVVFNLIKNINAMHFN